MFSLLPKLLSVLLAAATGSGKIDSRFGRQAAVISVTATEAASNADSEHNNVFSNP